MLFRRDGTGEPFAVPCLCKSWRCDGGCAWRVAREDYRRIEAGAVSRPDWIYAVLTVDPAAFRDRWHAFKVAGDLWNRRLRKRLQRAYGALDHIQTWEQHRSGWPHVNVLVRSDTLLEHVRALGVETRTARGPHGEREALFPRWRTSVFQDLVHECGFGLRVWAELIEARSASGMAAYLAKVAGELTRSHLKGGDQRPIEAPRGFHRLRSSPGLLPARAKKSELTGFLVRKHVDAIERELVDDATGELRALTFDDVDRLWRERPDVAAAEWFKRWARADEDTEPGSSRE